MCTQDSFFSLVFVYTLQVSMSAVDEAECESCVVRPVATPLEVANNDDDSSFDYLRFLNSVFVALIIGTVLHYFARFGTGVNFWIYYGGFAALGILYATVNNQ